MLRSGIPRRHIVRFIISMVAYALTVVSFSLGITRLESEVWRTLMALTPIVPIGFALYFQIRAFQSVDELQQRISGQAMMISALAVGLGTFAYGFLEQIGFPRFSTFLFFPMLIAGWGVLQSLIGRGYR